jgi:hypothetical protein
MGTNRSILDAFTIFPFAILLALALGEAFKLVVSEKEGEEFIAWKKLYALISFLLLILPFYQGMNRYLLLTYGAHSAAPGARSIFLIIDGAVFLFESALFFVMSRTLGIDKWQRFYWVVFVLLVVDTVWGLTVLMRAEATSVEVIKGWLLLNLITYIAIWVGVYALRRIKNHHVPAAIALGAMFVRTIVDYIIAWGFYFPQA